MTIHQWAQLTTYLSTLFDYLYVLTYLLVKLQRFNIHIQNHRTNLVRRSSSRIHGSPLLPSLTATRCQHTQICISKWLLGAGELYVLCHIQLPTVNPVSLSFLFFWRRDTIFESKWHSQWNTIHKKKKTHKMCTSINTHLQVAKVPYSDLLVHDLHSTNYLGLGILAYELMFIFAKPRISKALNLYTQVL